MLRRVHAALAALILLLTACQPAAPSGPTGTLRIGLATFQQESTAVWLGLNGMFPYIGAMYDPLITADDKANLTKDGVLRDWRLDSSGTEVTLLVRSGVRFQNGDVATADDVKFTFDTFMRPGLVSVSGNALRQMVKSVAVVDAETVKVTLNQPNALFLHQLSWLEGDMALIPMKYINSLPGSTFEEKEKAFVASPIASGPYKFVKRQLGVSIDFDANTSYWDSARMPKFQHLTVSLAADTASRVAQLETGQIDLAPIPSPQVPRLANSGLKVFDIKNTTHALVNFYGCYLPSQITSDPRIRQALILAVDRSAIAKSLFPEIPGIGLTATPVSGPALSGPGVVGWSESLSSYAYDPAKARQLLTDAGYTAKPQKLIFWSFTVAGLEEGPQIVNAIAEYWKAVGVQVEIRATDIASITPRFGQEPQQWTEAPANAGLHGASYRPSGLNNVRVFAAGPSAGGANRQGCDRAQIDEAYRSAIAISDSAQLQTRMQGMWRSMYEMYWALPVVWKDQLWVGNPKVISGWTPIPYSLAYLRYHTAVPAAP